MTGVGACLPNLPGRRTDLPADHLAADHLPSGVVVQQAR